MGCLLKFAFYCSDKHHDQKQLGEEIIYLAHTCRSQSIIEGSQRENPRQETGGSNWRRQRWIPHCTGLLPLAGSACLFTHLSGLDTPTLIIDQENAPRESPTGQQDGEIFSPEASSSQMTLACTTFIRNHPAQSQKLYCLNSFGCIHFFLPCLCFLRSRFQTNIQHLNFRFLGQNSSLQAKHPLLENPISEML